MGHVWIGVIDPPGFTTRTLDYIQFWGADSEGSRVPTFGTWQRWECRHFFRQICDRFLGGKVDGHEQQLVVFQLV